MTHATSFPCWSATWFVWECLSAWRWAFAAEYCQALTDTHFNWTRAIVAGGLAGLLGGFIFDRWMSAGEFFPLLAGLSELPSRTASLTLQFFIAVLMGVIFGLLFQRDVRSYGSCMGWGVGYAILWWFLGPMTIFPLAFAHATRLVLRRTAAPCSARWWATSCMA